MGINICELNEKRLIDRLRSLKVKGKVIEKRELKSFGGQSEKKILVIRFKNRIIDIPCDDSQFDRAEVGGQIWFNPPVPDRDPCNCHLFAWLIIGVAAGALAIWFIASHFHGINFFLLSFVMVAGISVITWAVICGYEQKKYLRTLDMEIDFFEAASDGQQGGQE